MKDITYTEVNILISNPKSKSKQATQNNKWLEEFSLSLRVTNADLLEVDN